MNFNLSEMMEKARNVQQEVEKIKAQSANIIVVGQAGGGMVSVKMNGNYQAMEVKISPELIQEKDAEMIQALVVAAINNATKELAEKLKDELSKVSSLLPNIPGLDKLGGF